MLLVLALIPQLLATAVNIAYNRLRIVADLSQAQRDSFPLLVLGYNAVIFPLLVVALVVPVRRAFTRCRQLMHEPDMPAPVAAHIRRSVMALPVWTVILAVGGLVFQRRRFSVLRWKCWPGRSRRTGL